MDTKKIGDFLSSLRKSNGLTQQDIAEQLSLSNKTISKWESDAGLPDISVLPALAELYGVTVDDILAGQRLKKAEVRQDTSKRWVYYIIRSQIKLDIAFLLALTLTVINFAVSPSPYNNTYSGWQHPVGMLLSLMLMTIGIILAAYPLQHTPQEYRSQISRRSALCLLLLISADLVSVSSVVAPMLLQHFGESLLIYNFHWAAALLTGLLWLLLTRRFGVMLTGLRRLLFLAGEFIILLSDAPAAVFSLINSNPGISMPVIQYEAIISTFENALPWFTYGGLSVLAISVVWQIAAERSHSYGK